MQVVDVLILGAGAAGMMCAIEAARRGRRVAVLDHARAPGEKIRISGGGRCNFTNLSTAPERFLSQNPRFALSALARFTPADFIARIDAAGIAWHEKTLGQLFCDDSAKQVVAMLTGQMAEAGAALELGAAVTDIAHDVGFTVTTDRGAWSADSLVIATGGKSIPKMGATGFGYRVAERFGLRLTDTRPALVPFTFAEQDLPAIKPLAGVSVPARVAAGRAAFDEALLFTHRGLSGPAVLQASSYWREGAAVTIDLCPGADVGGALRAARDRAGKQAVQTALGRFLPDRLAGDLVAGLGLAGPLAAQSNAALDALGQRVNRWQVKPVGTEGYRTAEVTLGGVDTRDLDAKTMRARAVPGLYFIGEVVDVTGHLGGHNFQWAWASGHAAGQYA